MPQEAQEDLDSNPFQITNSSGHISSAGVGGVANIDDTIAKIEAIKSSPVPNASATSSSNQINNNASNHSSEEITVHDESDVGHSVSGGLDRRNSTGGTSVGSAGTSGTTGSSGSKTKRRSWKKPKDKRELS